jgi:hypothetical protein
MTDRRGAHERPDVVDAVGLLAVPSSATVRDATVRRLGTLVARPPRAADYSLAGAR